MAAADLLEQTADYPDCDMAYPLISVIICSHNPRPDYLKRVVAGLKEQGLNYESWEFLLIDNAGNQVLAESVDLVGHPHARHVREDKLGLTPSQKTSEIL